MFKTGDVISVPCGAHIAVPLEKRFVVRNQPNSTELTHEVVQLGDILHAEGNAELDTRIFVGKYVVVDASEVDGASGMNAHDTAPRAMKFIAKRLDVQDRFDPVGISIRFYVPVGGRALDPGQILPTVVGVMQQVFVSTPDQFNAIDYIASQLCESNTGMKWWNATAETKELWRSEGKVMVAEWSAENHYHSSSKSRDTTDSIEP